MTLRLGALTVALLIGSASARAAVPPGHCPHGHAAVAIVASRAASAAKP
jgi:hypothetical protein